MRQWRARSQPGHHHENMKYNDAMPGIGNPFYLQCKISYNSFPSPGRERGRNGLATLKIARKNHHNSQSGTAEPLGRERRMLSRYAGTPSRESPPCEVSVRVMVPLGSSYTPAISGSSQSRV